MIVRTSTGGGIKNSVISRYILKLDKQFHWFTSLQLIQVSPEKSVKQVNMSTIIDDLPVRRIPAKRNSPKVKIEFADQLGAKYSFAIESPSKENMAKLLDFIQSISNDNSSQIAAPIENEPTPADTNFNKVFGLVQNKFRFGSFTSNDVFLAYEEHFKLKTTLSTMSTYLARLAERGVLTRLRNGAGWIYKLARSEEAPSEQSVQAATLIEA